MAEIVSANPFRCRVWDMHDRHDHMIDESTCRIEIRSFSDHGQLIAALGRPLRGDPDHDIELICGARRLFIARHLNIPLRVDLQEMTDRAAVIAMDIENRQRRDVSPYERGMCFARILRGGYFDSQEDLARSLKISQSQVSRLLALARLPAAVISAFSNPMDIRECWGLDLVGILQDASKREATIARARILGSTSPKPSAVDVYQQLISISVAGRRVRTRSHDEVVTDVDGTPLFRIRPQDKTIAVLLPRAQISEGTLDAVREAVRGVLQHKTPYRITPKQPASSIRYDCDANSVEGTTVDTPSSLVPARAAFLDIEHVDIRDAAGRSRFTS